MGKYLLLPSSGDLNRGDQALVWETVDSAKKAGHDGTFYMLSQNKELTKQSQANGIEVIIPILKHPSRKFESKENKEYNSQLIFKWGTVALFDFLFSILLLNKITRGLMSFFLAEEDKKTLEIFKTSDACFVKGGGFIHSTGKLTDSYTVYYQLFHIMFAQSLNKKVYVMPNSFGPFDGFAVKWLVNRVLNRCELVTVRESISKKMLQEIDVNAHLFPDLGFKLRKKERQNIEICQLREKYPQMKLVGITARPYRFPKSENPKEKYAHYIQEMVLFSKWLYSNGYLPIFVEHTLSETTHENDGTAIEEIVSKLNSGEFEIISNDSYDCKDLKAIYSEMDMVVGTRFHSVIFSLSEQVPSIAITYGGNKGQGIMKDLGISQYAISISDFESKSSIKMIQDIDNNYEEYKQLLASRNEDINKKHNELLSFMKN